MRLGGSFTSYMRFREKRTAYPTMYSANPYMNLEEEEGDMKVPNQGNIILYFGEKKNYSKNMQLFKDAKEVEKIKIGTFRRLTTGEADFLDAGGWLHCPERPTDPMKIYVLIFNSKPEDKHLMIKSPRKV